MQDAVPLSEFESSQVDYLPKSHLALLMKVIEAIAAALLAGIIILMFAGVISRYVLNSPLTEIDEILVIMFMWLVMLGSVIAMARGEHLRLTFVVNSLGPNVRQFLETLGSLLVLTFLIGLLYPSYKHLMLEHSITIPGLDLPKSIRSVCIPIAIVMMILIVFLHLIKKTTLLQICVSLAIVILISAGLWQINRILEDFSQTPLLLILVGFIAATLSIGVPIAFCFGIGAMAFILFGTHIPLTVIVGRMDEGMGSPILLSVPAFILLGAVLDGTGMGKSIVDFVSSLVGHVKGGMSYVLLGSMYLVSGISGSKVSDMATVAPALFPEMRRRGNKPTEMVALLGTGSIMADTVPPAIILIVLGSVAGLSISQLFVSGFSVAFFLLVILAVVARWRSRNEDMTGVERVGLKNVLLLTKVAVPALMLPLFIRMAVGEGIATATEVSTVAIFYSVIVGTCMYKSLDLRSIYRILVEGAAMTGSILFILGTAVAASWALTQTGFAGRLAVTMATLPGGWVTFMIASITVFIVLGCLLEGLPALVLLAPLMFPIAAHFGINEIQYGMVMVVSMNIGLFMPPVGIGYYIACRIGKVDPDTAMKDLFPYMLALFVGLLCIAFIPAISLAFI
ncbi:TRAP transporter large permease subunit [Mesorhizobium sp. M0701]|uniref:TRAP transporter large permease n=1 Tax=Mesorhizobium sp. M0701 TaxID=2956989 RepID=UPI003335E79C